MNNLTKQLVRLSVTPTNLFKTTKLVNFGAPLVTAGLHTTSSVTARYNKHNTGPQKWLQYNKVVHPPQKPEEEPRKAVSLCREMKALILGNCSKR